MKNDVEFFEHPPCGHRVYSVYKHGSPKDKFLIGFCIRRINHNGTCSHLINDRVVHNLRADGHKK